MNKLQRIKKINLPVSAPYALLAILLLGIFIFQMTSIALVSTTFGINFLKDGISILVYTPYGWVQAIAFFMFGVSLLAVALLLQFKVSVRLNLGAIVLALMGFSFFIISSCPTHLTGTPTTLENNMHGWATAAAVMLFPIACFLIASTLRTLEFRFLYIYTIAVGILQLLFILIGGYFLVTQQGMVGIYERVMLWNGQIWIIAVSMNLLLAEVKQRFPLKMHKQLVARFAVCGLLFVYCTMLLPMCLPIHYLNIVF